MAPLRIARPVRGRERDIERWYRCTLVTCFRPGPGELGDFCFWYLTSRRAVFERAVARAAF